MATRAQERGASAPQTLTGEPTPEGNRLYDEAFGHGFQEGAATGLRPAPEALTPAHQRGGDLAGAVCEAIAALEMIGERGCFDNLPADEADHAAHNRGVYLLQLVERALRAAVQDFDGFR